MTITTENPAATADTKKAEITEFLDRMKAESTALLDRANRTIDPDAATAQGVAAADMFEKIHEIGKAVEEALADTGDLAGFDLDQLQDSITRQRPDTFKVTIPYHPSKGMFQWTCTDTLIELRGARPRTLAPLKPAPTSELTWSDYFAGAGGSSSGIRQAFQILSKILGGRVALAVNHWPLAIETHNFNHPDTDHDQASLARTHPSRYPRTDFAWFSPECTYWSVARGDKCDYDMDAEQLTLDLMDDEDDTPEAKEAKWRSRMLMRDVVRFSRWHQYKAVIVENVPDILKWAALDRWLADMAAEGYRHKILTLNSAFSGVLGPAAPQLRDRVYVIFWKACYKEPNWNKWLRPKGYCTGCDEVVDSIYTAKPGGRRPMRYGPRAQYTYRCPKKACHGKNVRPMVRPASSAIDFTLPSQRIGDRKRPLAKKTYDRVAAGVNLYFNTPLLTPTGGSRYDNAIPVTDPMRTFTTRESHAVVVPMEGRGPVSSIRPVNAPFRTSTGRHQDALLEHPGSFIAPLRNNGNPEPTTAPMRTFAANGYHHALVMRNNEGGSEMSTPIHEPIRTLTTAGHQSLLQDGQEGHTLFSYDTGLMRPLDEPMPAQTTIAGDALVSGRRFIKVDDCYLRMLAIEEIQEGMAFGRDYVLLGSSKRNKAKMLGNAVTWNTARDLAAMVMEAVTGDEIDIPASAALWLPN